MQLQPPSGWSVYGHQQEAYASADGAVYWSGFFFLANVPKDRSQFGWYIVRQAAQSAFISRVGAESGQLTYQPGRGLFMAYAQFDGQRKYEPVAGFVDGGPVSGPVPTPGPSGVDPEARNMAQAALTQARAAHERADLGVRWSQDNERRTEAVAAAVKGKVSRQEAEEIAWTKAGDRIFQEIAAAVKDKVSRQEAEEIAWTKAGDRITDWWNKMVRYETPQLFNTLWNRTRKILITAKVPGADQLPVNKDETLLM